MKNCLLVIYRMSDYCDNKTTLAVSLREDKTLNYSCFSGWQFSGTPHAISNMQLKQSLPMSARAFTYIEELDKKIQDVLRTGVYKLSEHEVLNDL